jgi:hypothetical protein
VSFRPQSVRGAPDAAAAPGEVDYRLARNAVLKELRRGRLSRLDVCDAHPELLRTARSIGQRVPTGCPVCESDQLVHVSYAFGVRLSPGGQAFSDAGELAKLVRRAGAVACYVVEVCPACSWNHLVRTFAAGRRRSVATS